MFEGVAIVAGCPLVRALAGQLAGAVGAHALSCQRVEDVARQAVRLRPSWSTEQLRDQLAGIDGEAVLPFCCRWLSAICIARDHS